MSTPDEVLRRKLEREISARKQAESLLEQKSLELFIEAQERQEALARLKESEERYRQIVEMSPDAILVEIDGTVVFANTAARRLFAESPQLGLVGRTLEEVGLDESTVGATEDPASRIETVAHRLDGSRCEVALRSLPLVYDGQHARQLVARDISDRKRLEKQLAYQATHDPLTGVSNRSALLEQLADALALARRNHSPVWVAFLDLDRFKQVNDRFGHRAGDELLAEVTARLSKVLREDDIIGRYGGDEFIIVMRGGPGSSLNPPLLQRILQLVSEPIDVDGYQLQVTGSLGVAAYPEDGDNAELLLERADAAMYQAKQAGRNLYQDGNARMGLLLTRLLLLQGGYSQVAYSSLEAQFERDRDAYYTALDRTLVGMETQNPHWEPWTAFFLNALVDHARRLFSKLERDKEIFSALPKLSSDIVNLAREHGRVTMAEAIRLTGSNRNTLKLHFRKLVHEGRLLRHGMGAGVWYQPR